MEKDLILAFNLNMERIRKANGYFKNKKGSKKSIEKLDNIIIECNDICNKLISLEYDINKLDMEMV